MEKYQHLIDAGNNFAALAGRPDCNLVLWQGIGIREIDGEIHIERQLPQKWELSDYSVAENLIEIADLSSGERFWISPLVLFLRNLTFDQPILFIRNGGANIKDISHHQTVRLTRIGTSTKRKKVYLIAILSPQSY